MPIGVYKRTLKTRAALSAARIGKPIPWMHTPEIHKKISATLTGRSRPDLSNEKHPAWKGDEASYGSFHLWLNRNYGKASKCENPDCKYPRTNRAGKTMYEAKYFEWALKHGEKHGHYRERYMQLCKSDHNLYDMGLIEIEI